MTAKNKKPFTPHHPQHQLSITYLQTFELIQDHGPIDLDGIIKNAAKLPRNQQRKIFQKKFKAPDVKHSDGSTEEQFYTPIRKSVTAYLRNLSRNGLIQRAGKGAYLSHKWIVTVTFSDVIKMLDRLEYPYVVQKKFTISSNGIAPATLKLIKGLLEQDRKLRLVVDGSGGDSDGESEDDTEDTCSCGVYPHADDCLLSDEMDDI